MLSFPKNKQANASLIVREDVQWPSNDRCNVHLIRDLMFLFSYYFHIKRKADKRRQVESYIH